MSQRWVVAEVEHRIGFLGMTEQDAIKDLHKRGFETYWMHYREVWARPRLPNGQRTTQLGKVKPVLRGYYAPFLFVAIESGDLKAVSAQVEEIGKARYIFDVLWSEAAPFYLPALGYCACGERCVVHRQRSCGECNFLDWVKSVRIDQQTGINEDPVPIDPAAGLFEPPPDMTRQGRAARFMPGDKVSTTGKWRYFEQMIGCQSVVKGVDSKGKVIVQHLQMLGAEATESYEPEQVEKL